MKQKIFTLVMMLALVIVAGSAYALNDINVYQGGTYNYSLSGVGSTLAATASATIDETNAVVDETGGSWTIPAASSGLSVTFDITYENAAGDTYSAVGSAIITVVVQDNTNGCSNSIELHVTVLAAPSLTLAVTNATADFCQAKGTAGDNTDEYAGGPYNNDITFTVDRTAGALLANVASMSYNLNISESGALIAAGDEGDKAKTAVGDHTVSFNSAEGAGTTVTAAVQSGGTFTMNAANGGGTYDITAGASDNTVVRAVPTIGSF